MDFEELKAIALLDSLRDDFDRLKELDGRDHYETIKEYFTHNEWVLAIETLCTILDEYSIKINKKVYDELIEIGISFNVSSDYLLPMKKLIKPH